jgi:hypothetical protein
MVPEPSGEAWTATWGEDESAVRLPEALDFSLVEKVAVPIVAGGVTAFTPPPDP